MMIFRVLCALSIIATLVSSADEAVRRRRRVSFLDVDPHVNAQVHREQDVFLAITERQQFLEMWQSNSFGSLPNSRPTKAPVVGGGGGNTPAPSSGSQPVVVAPTTPTTPTVPSSPVIVVMPVVAPSPVALPTAPVGVVPTVPSPSIVTPTAPSPIATPSPPTIDITPTVTSPVTTPLTLAPVVPTPTMIAPVATPTTESPLLSRTQVPSTNVVASDVPSDTMASDVPSSSGISDVPAQVERTEAPVVLINNNNGTCPASRQDALLQTLNGTTTNATLLLDDTTPQGQAFAWLLNTDTTTPPCADNIPQRYGLAVLNYHWQGSLATTNSTTMWLTAAPECEWQYVTCDANASVVVELQFST